MDNKTTEEVLVRDGNGEFVTKEEAWLRAATMKDLSALEKHLDEWIREHHDGLRCATMDKARQYGSLDLSIMGASIAKLWPGIGEGAPPGAQLQAAIAFYLMGKVARVLSALAEGKDAPTDSWRDAEVYSMMGLYVQEHGQWP